MSCAPSISLPVETQLLPDLRTAQRLAPEYFTYNLFPETILRGNRAILNKAREFA